MKKAGQRRGRARAVARGQGRRDRSESGGEGDEGHRRAAAATLRTPRLLSSAARRLRARGAVATGSVPGTACALQSAACARPRGQPRPDRHAPACRDGRLAGGARAGSTRVLVWPVAGKRSGGPPSASGTEGRTYRGCARTPRASAASWHRKVNLAGGLKPPADREPCRHGRSCGHPAGRGGPPPPTGASSPTPGPPVPRCPHRVVLWAVGVGPAAAQRAGLSTARAPQKNGRSDVAGGAHAAPVQKEHQAEAGSAAPSAGTRH